MNSSDYHKYLAAINAAKECEVSRAQDLLRGIQADMIARYGLSDDDVK